MNDFGAKLMEFAQVLFFSFQAYLQYPGYLISAKHKFKLKYRKCNINQFKEKFMSFLQLRREKFLSCVDTLG